MAWIRSSAAAIVVGRGPQLPWLLVIGDWSDDDPGVAAQDEESEAESSRELVELELAAEAEESTALSMPATTRDRAAGRRRTDQRVPTRRGPGADGGLWSITIPLRALIG